MHVSESCYRHLHSLVLIAGISGFTFSQLEMSEQTLFDMRTKPSFLTMIPVQRSCSLNC